MKHQPNRRKFLTAGAATAAGVLLPFGVAGAKSRLATPQQTEGPFYPVQDQADKDVDLTQVIGQDKPAQGKIIRVTGKVYDEDGAIIKDAFVEIWQANSFGRYRHPRDPSGASLDPGFQGWGQTRSAGSGDYGFKTILPAAYPAGPGWVRPPHIHFKINKPGYVPLTTQMYFPGQSLNQEDRILQHLSKQQQALVISRPAGSATAGVEEFIFDIFLKKS